MEESKKVTEYRHKLNTDALKPALEAQGTGQR